MKLYKFSIIVLTLAVAAAALPQAALAQVIIDRVTVKEKVPEQGTLGGTQISFYTNSPTTARLDYGTTTNYGFFNGSSALAMYHEILLVGLKGNTTYHYRITVRTAQGEETSTLDYTFKTGKTTSGSTSSQLAISDVRVTHVGGTYFIVTWLTYAELTGEVHFNTVENFVKPSKAKATRNGTRYEAVVAKLKLNTKYYWRVFVKDKDGNTGSSSVQTITTSTSDNSKEPLVVSEVSPSSQADLRLTDTTALVRWRTNLPARADVSFKSTVRGVKGGSMKATVYVTDHEAILTNLKPNTPYTFTIVALDVYGKKVTSGQFGFTTKALPRVAGATACPRGAAVWAYGQCRNLTSERTKALELRGNLNRLYHNRVPGSALRNWYILVNAYTYGGYSLEAIAAAVRHGGKT
ncbi:MAG: hypothetical protein U1C53_01730, partial [Candidatus Veblenbacteria bacterium]|nr:hypothetical protein [Candidatus Veblenbacteria bacterium]